MKLVLRFFVVFVLFEMMMVYHCFGNEANRYPDVHPSFAQEGVIQTDFTRSAPDFYEIPEVKEANESDEEEVCKKLLAKSDLIQFNCWDFCNKGKNSCLQDFNRQYGISTAPLFILFHRWKFHL
jgi:hypothetical protein